MLNFLLGTDWIANRDTILQMVAKDVADECGNRILLVPELISHETERRLCTAAGDTASRFAEVLSFTHLARRVTDSFGHAAQECLDDGGRVVAMASAVRQMHSKLKAYASVETRPEFLMGLVEAVDEFKRCCISSKELLAASKKTEGSLAQKLEELALLFEAYDSVCLRGKRDPRDQMTWLLEQLEDIDFAQSHVFYIDGFTDFTRQQMAILEYLICVAPNVTISLNCDRLSSKRLSFERAGSTAYDLSCFAHRHGIEVSVTKVSPRNIPLQAVTERLFQGDIEPLDLGDSLQLFRANSLYSECLTAAEKIMELVRNGSRYRDIAVVCSDIASYHNSVNMVFNRCGIPMYLAGTDDILDKTVITTVLAALDAALDGFERKDVFRYLRSVLSPLDMDLCDRLENYVILWGIDGKRWKTDWINHPYGLGEEWTDAAQLDLQELNAARKLALDPLIHLQNHFSEATDMRGQIRSLYSFFEEINLSDRLGRLAMELDSLGDNRNAQILNQLWEILLTALEQMYDILGDTIWDAETFTRLFRLLLSQYNVGTIPPVLDAVTVGPVSSMRYQQSKHLIVLGATEGSFPAYGSSGGILTDQERTTLREMGVQLTAGAMDGLQAEFAEIYALFCGTERSITVLCSASQPSFIYRRLSRLAGIDREAPSALGAVLTDKMEAGAFLVRWNASDAAKKLGIESVYGDIFNRRNHKLGQITEKNIRNLYGQRLNLSASQVDRLAECRLSYFLKYGLRAKERKPAAIDPAEFGTYVHAVLEKTVREIMELGGFAEVTMERTLEIARGHSEAYAKERFSQIDTKRLTYLFQRNSLELEMIVKELWQEMQGSSFVPVGFEVAFGDGEEMSAIPIPGENMDAQLRGFVDRVDRWDRHGQNFFRVVDYKTGKKDFDYCDVFNGLGLQMLLYLFALEQEGRDLLGEDPVPAGVQYFPARVPLIPSDGILTDDEASSAREKAWKRKGLLLGDEEVLQAMEASDSPIRMPYTRKKDGSISGDLADREQFHLLKAYIYMLLGRMVDDIASGNVEPNPYTRGSSHNACAFCPYGTVCHQNTVEGRRNYRAMTAERFWNEIGKEMHNRG